MHEASIARQILAASLAHAHEAEARRVVAVRGWVAETEALSRESIIFQFAAHARGTAAEGARLELSLVQVAARCGSCGTTYAPEHHLLLCPACGSTEAGLLGRTGLGIESIDVE